MLNYNKLARKPKQFQKFTGITVQQFDFLFSKIEKQYKITEMQRLSKRERIRDIGAGRPFKLSVKERILMLLIYYRCYTSYDLLEYLFGVDSSTVCRDIAKIEPAVIQCIPIPAKIYADSKKITNMQELQVFFPDFYAITDATEQQISRPKDKHKRKTHYSGKKKKHTIKNQITINLKGEIIHKPPHAPGSHHNYNTFKSKHPILPEDVATFYDLRYQGVEKDFPNVEFLKIDVDKVPSVAQKYFIKSIPVLLLFKFGEIRGGVVGGQSKAQIAELIKSELEPKKADATNVASEV